MDGCSVDGFRIGDVVYFDCDSKEGYGIISNLNEFGYGEVFLIGSLRNTGHSSGWGSKIHEKFVGGYSKFYSYWNVDTSHMKLASNKIR